MNKKVKTKISTLFMLVVLLAQTLTPVVTVFAEDTTMSTQTSSEVQSISESTSQVEVGQGETTTSNTIPVVPNTTPPSTTPPSTTVSSEVSTSTDVSSESPTSESQEVVATEESTEEDEEPAQSSTEASETTNESTEISETKSTEIKKNIRREPVNISTLFEEDDKFITNLVVKVDDKQVSEGTLIEAKHDSIIEINYTWGIPESLLGGAGESKLRSGDFYEISIPEGMEVYGGGGPLEKDGIVYGRWAVDIETKKVRFTFNETVETENDIQGTFLYDQKLKGTGEAGKTQIVIPRDDEKFIFDLDIKPNINDGISKEVADNSKINEIKWSVQVNKTLEGLKDATLEDPMPVGKATIGGQNYEVFSTFESAEVYQLKVLIDGTVTRMEPKLNDPEDYTIDSTTGKIMFKDTVDGENPKAYEVVYTSKIDQTNPHILEAKKLGGKFKFENTATFTNDGDPIKATASADKSYQPLLVKDMKGSKDGQRYTWEIKYNQGKELKNADTEIKDTITEGNLEIDYDTIKVYIGDSNTEYPVGKYEVIETSTKEFTIKLKEETSEYLRIVYDTQFKTIINEDREEELKNTVSAEGVEVPGIGTATQQGLKKKSIDIDYDKKLIWWEITINSAKHEMEKWTVTDEVLSGIFMHDSLRVSENGKEIDPNLTPLPYDYISNTNKTGFTLNYTKQSSSTFTVKYATSFDPEITKNPVAKEYINDAKLYWETPDGQEFEHTAESKRETNITSQSDISKGGNYNAQTKEITWTIQVNYNQQKLDGAQIIDTITKTEEDLQKYVSVEIEEGTIGKDGKFINGVNVTEQFKKEKRITDTDFTTGRENLSISLPDTAPEETKGKAYRVTIVTSIKNTVINKKQKVQDNFVTYTNKQKDYTASASIEISNAGNHLEKNAVQNKEDQTIINWSVPINKAQSTLSNVVIKDTPSSNQLFLPGTIKLYKTKVAKDGTVSKDNNSPLEQDRDYKYSINTEDVETGQQQLVLELIGDYQTIHTALWLEYQTVIESPVDPVKISNSATMSSSEFGEDDYETNVEEFEVKLSASVGGTSTKVKLQKIDSETKTPLANAKLELWSTKKDEKGKLVKRAKIRSGITDAKGELKFSGLAAGRQYLLFETEAPDGYTVSGLLLEGGQPIKLGTEYENDYKLETVSNELSSVSLTKKSKAEQGLKSTLLNGAKFILQKSDGSTYTGENDAPVIDDNWKKLSQEEYKTEAFIFTSEKGVVTARGLVPGEYHFIEIASPENYIEPSKDKIPFTVIKKEDGTVSVKEPISNVLNTREKTSITVTKKWANENEHLATRPGKVEIQLLRNGKTNFGIINQTINIAAGEESVIFEDLVKYDDAGNPFNYSAVEVNPDKQYAPGEAVIDQETKNITITNTLKTTNIPVEKRWVDSTDSESRPKSINVQLLSKEKGAIEGTEAVPVEGIPVLVLEGTNENSIWKGFFEGLPTHNSKGEELEYSVKELNVKENSYATTYSLEGNTRVITNTLNTADFVVSKKWNDGTDNSLRPTEIQVQLYRHIAGKEEDKKPVREVQTISKTTASESEPSVWKITYNGLATYDVNGQEYIYSVKEVNGPGNYDPEYDGLTIKNVLKTIDIPIEKSWIDSGDATSRPDKIIVDLYRYIEGENRPTDAFKTVQLTATDDWKYEFKGLASENSLGKPFVYELTEREVKGYTGEVTNISKAIGQYNFRITNELKSLDIPVEKFWNDSDDETSRPDEITVDLYRYVKGETRPTEPFKTVQLEGKNDWKYEFNGLASENSLGVSYTYELTEREVKAYTSEVTNISKAIGQYNFRITNELKSLDIPVEKVWNDSNDKTSRPDEITVDLYRYVKGEKRPTEPFKTVQLTAKDGWKHEFKGLASENSLGELYTYELIEREVKAYTSEVINVSKVIGQYNYRIVNTLRTLDIPVEKNWNDPTDVSSRPDKIVIDLYRESETNKENKFSEDKKSTPFRTLELAPSNKWQNHFAGLSKEDKSGNEYTYTIREREVLGYTTEISGSQKDGFKVINTLKLIQINVTKNWSDFSNQFGLRPDDIHLQLMKRVGEELVPVEKVTIKDNHELETNKVEMILSDKVKDKDQKSFVFSDLTKYDENGKEIQYVVTETPVTGYETTVENIKTEVDGEQSVIVTNALETIDIPVTKVWKDTFKGKENYYQSRPESITIRLKQNGKEIAQVPAVKVVDKEGNWSHVFKDLPKLDKDGEAYEYEVTEDTVDKYNTKIDVNESNKVTITNTRKTYAIGDYTWIDSNNDGMQGEDEEILEGVIVELFDEKGNPILDKDGKPMTTTTDKNGRYIFDELEDGKYTIKFTLTKEQSEKYEFTKQDAGENDKSDSDADELTGWTTTITLNDDSKELTKDYTDQKFKATEGIDPTWDAGVILREKIEVTGTKVWVGGPKVKPTIELQLYRNGEKLGKPVELRDGTTTYTWKDLYKTDTNKAPYVYTVQEVGTPSEYNKTEEGLKVTNTRKTYAIGDYTWIDTDKDGIQDKNEPVLPGVKVELFDENGKKIAETTTDKNGRYIFDELESGKYKVKFTLTDEQKKLYKFTKRHSGDAAKDSNADDEGWTIDIDLNENNAFLTLDYTDQTFKASEGIDPTWDAGVILLDVPVKPADPKDPKPELPQMGEAGNPFLLTSLGILLIGSVVGVVTTRRRRQG